jgi:hypothetical protein
MAIDETETDVEQVLQRVDPHPERVASFTGVGEFRRGERFGNQLFEALAGPQPGLVAWRDFAA